MSQEHVEMEFAKEIMEMQQTQQTGQGGPQLQKAMEELNLKMESRKAVIIAEYTDEFMVQEKEITNAMDNDPLIQLKEQELGLKAQENLRRKEESEARINLDKMKMFDNRTLTREKMAQNEELAELRADTSITKQVMSNEAKRRSDLTKRYDVNRLKDKR